MILQLLKVNQRNIIASQRSSVSRGLKGLVVGVPKEITEGEARVALTPPSCCQAH